MSRLPDLAYDQMSDEQKRIHDEIASGPRGAVVGPLKVWLHSPALADRAQKLGAHARYHSSLPPHLSELAILTTGSIWQADFEWYAHVGPAREAGISEAVIEAIRTGAEPPFEDEASRVVHQVAREVHESRRLSAESYANARNTLGEQGLVDLIGILGYYTLISMTLNVFEVETPDGSAPFADRR
ncbi:MAG: carboxymuconolactone decarboxylase family protein [Geminicoccaceae bacterium]